MPSSSDIHIRIGVRKKDGRCIGINEVERGLRCGCICKACGHPLIARQGKIRDWHFAHADRSDCKGMGETHLHLAAKQILLDRKEIFLPDFRGREYGQKGDPDREYLTESMLSSPFHQDLREEAMGFITKSELVQAEKVRAEESLD
ncbi:MAG: competence protein CoiA family protein [Paracoccaceae bacterium]|nr:competence protein CoiA family protein [Paracoccaceae bacterium]MDE2916916.1 competence protein CoiA family protein [Paracoccaceae bacterium]